jgi:hypothetical protein
MIQCEISWKECDGDVLSIALGANADEFMAELDREEESAEPVDTSEKWREEARKWKRMALWCVAAMAWAALVKIAIWAGSR